MEIRIKDVSLLAEDDSLMKVGGYINVTERESEMLYSKKSGKWFKEIMKRGVFQKAIEKAKEIPLLFEHDWGKKLANTSNNTLTLKEDNVGLRFEAVIEDRSVYEQVKSGIINSCSFGFRALEESIEPINQRLERRTVTGIELLEVSLVKNPAYVGSLAEVRAYEEEVAKDAEQENAEEVIEEIRKEDESKPEEAKGAEKEDEKSEDPAEEAEEPSEEDDSEEKEEDSQKRELEALHPSVEAAPEVEREVLVSIVNELIEQKMNELKEAEFAEEIAKEQLEEVKEFHDMVEKDIAEDCMKYNSEVIKMRLQLLKLSILKEGI